MLYFLTENTNYTSVDFLCMSSGNTISSNTIYFFYFCDFSRFSDLSLCFKPDSFYFSLSLNFSLTLQWFCFSLPFLPPQVCQLPLILFCWPGISSLNSSLNSHKTGTNVHIFTIATKYREPHSRPLLILKLKIVRCYFHLPFFPIAVCCYCQMFICFCYCLLIVFVLVLLTASLHRSCICSFLYCDW